MGVVPLGVEIARVFDEVAVRAERRFQPDVSEGVDNLGKRSHLRVTAGAP